MTTAGLRGARCDRILRPIDGLSQQFAEGRYDPEKIRMGNLKLLTDFRCILLRRTPPKEWASLQSDLTVGIAEVDKKSLLRIITGETSTREWRAYCRNVPRQLRDDLRPKPHNSRHFSPVYAWLE